MSAKVYPEPRAVEDDHFLPVSWRISSASASRYGFPSGRSTSWNHTGGGSRMYGCCHDSQGRFVCVLPTTNPQLIAPTFSSLAIGKIVSKVLPTERAINSVQMTGRLYFFSQPTSLLKYSGQL